MDFGVVRNKRQVLALCERIMQRRIPFKYALQSIYPIRSIEFNDYLWGFIYTPIAEATGHTPDEVHEECKRRHNFKYDFVYNPHTGKYDISLGTHSTTQLDTKHCWDYALKIRAEAEIELHLTLALPNESFIPELDFDHDKIELRRL